MFCVYCGDKFNDNKPLVAHRKICKMNPKSEANVKKEEDTKNKLYIDMQKRVQCYDDIFIEVDKFIAKQGFIIDWEEKPSRFTTNVNKQLYGKKPLIDDENNYCGWIGNFKGTITKIDGFETKKSRCSFWDLNGEMSGIYGMKFLRTSGGSWSSGFSGSGFLLVNDFPKIQQQMLGTMKSDQTTESIQNEVSVIQKELQREAPQKIRVVHVLGEGQRQHLVDHDVLQAALGHHGVDQVLRLAAAGADEDAAAVFDRRYGGFGVHHLVGAMLVQVHVASPWAPWVDRYPTLP